MVMKELATEARLAELRSGNPEVMDPELGRLALRATAYENNIDTWGKTGGYMRHMNGIYYLIRK